MGILLSHGYTATTAEVRLLASHLHEEGYTVAGPLLPGHGTSPEDANRFRWQDWVGAVKTTYLELASRCERVVVGGESLGALLALYLASEQPEVAAVLAYAPAVKIPSRLTPTLAPLAARLMRYRPKPAHAPSAADARWQGYSVNPVKAALQLFHFQREVGRRLAHIQQPVLIVQGRLDASIDPGAADIVFRGVRSEVKELHWMGLSTHCVILDCEWESVLAITRRFLVKVLKQAVNS